MAFFSLIAVLLLEQVYPLDHRRWVEVPLCRVAAFVERHVNAGERRHAQIAWSLIVVGMTVFVLCGYFVLRALNPLLGGLWNFAWLYLALGFRVLARNFQEVQMALRLDDLPRAQAGVCRWRPGLSVPAAASTLAAVLAEEALLRAHRRVFGVLACYLLFPGPAGAVLYALAEGLAGCWGQARSPDTEHFAEFSRQAYARIDWLPARLSAGAFAIVGDFESAVYCWRTQVSAAAGSAGPQAAIVLAAGAGALGLRLDDGRFGVGSLADADSLRRVTGLLSRAFVLWLLILMLAGVAQ